MGWVGWGGTNSLQTQTGEENSRCRKGKKPVNSSKTTVLIKGDEETVANSASSTMVSVRNVKGR